MWALLLLGAGSLGASDPGSVSLAYHDGRLSLTARDASVGDILVQLERATGIAIHLAPGGEIHVPQEATVVAFENLAIEQGLERLLGHFDYALLYSSAGLAEIRVYGRRDVDARAPPASHGVPPRRVPAPRKPPATSASIVAEPASVVELRAAALADPDASSRLQALLRLSELDQPAATLDTALRILGTERDPTVLTGVIDVLGDLESTPVEPLLDFVRRSQAHGPRIRALEFLGERKLNDLRVVELLKTTAAGDRSPEVRENAQALLRGASGQ